MSKTPSDRDPATYAGAGVDIDAGNRLVDLIKPALKKTLRPGADGSIGGFGGLFDLAQAGYADPLLVAATDGVGTKLKLALDLDLFDTIGIDLVAMCVNDLVVQGAEPLFFLDYFATGRLDPERAAAIVGGIAEGCSIAGAALIGGETAEMPGLYKGNEFDLAGFAVGAVERARLLPREGIEAGDVILGLTSSGIHSNGFSLVRKVVGDAGVSLHDKAPFATGHPVGETLLTPTRIYVDALLKLLRHTDAVKALAHITGGGITENLPRVLPKGLAANIDLDAMPLPGIFGWLRELGSIADEEMLRVFNCGVGMIIIVPKSEAVDVASFLRSAGETVTEIGKITAPRGAPVVYAGALQ